MSQTLYAPWPESARRTWGWGALGLVVLTYGLSALPLFMIIAILVVVEVAGGGDPAAAQQALTQAPPELLLPFILIQFFLWALLIWLWARLFERRSGPTFGVRLSGGAIVRYGLGLILGVGLLAAIGAMAVLLGAGEGERLAVDSIARLTDPAILASFVLVIGVFLVQGGAEEIVFRGWLMSTLAARWGVSAAALVSSLFFMVFHAHVFISGVLFGVIALTGLGLVGLVFALLCLLTRSVIEAIAAHGAFNAAAVTLPTAVLLLENPDMSLSQAFAQVFASATGTAGTGATPVGPEMLAQGLAAGVIAAILAWLLVRRGPPPLSKEQIE